MNNKPDHNIKIMYLMITLTAHVYASKEFEFKLAGRYYTYNRFIIRLNRLIPVARITSKHSSSNRSCRACEK